MKIKKHTLLNGNNYHQMHAVICDILNLHKEITFIDKFQLGSDPVAVVRRMSAFVWNRNLQFMDCSC